MKAKNEYLEYLQEVFNKLEQIVINIGLDNIKIVEGSEKHLDDILRLCTDNERYYLTCYNTDVTSYNMFVIERYIEEGKIKDEYNIIRYFK